MYRFKMDPFNIEFSVLKGFNLNVIFMNSLAPYKFLRTHEITILIDESVKGFLYKVLIILEIVCDVTAHLSAYSERCNTLFNNDYRV